MSGLKGKWMEIRFRLRHSSFFYFLTAFMIFSVILKYSQWHFKELHTSESRTSANLLLVVVAINMSHVGLAAKSHYAYAQRYGYRLHIQKEWRGRAPRPKFWKAVRSQKLLACSLAQTEKFVLVIDADVVIAPWSPPIHLEKVGSKIGVVDENQPAGRVSLKESIVNGYRYYKRPFGDRLFVPHAFLNTGVLLLQPFYHQEWLENLYYSAKSQKWFNTERELYDQPLLGAAMIQKGNYVRIRHAWNRNWFRYQYSKDKNGKRYKVEDIFKKSYFLHFLWRSKESMNDLELWMNRNNVTFDGVNKYSEQILP